MRGNRTARNRVSARARSIPACAGEPLALRRERAPVGVYPRVCGGTALINRLALSERGLSPRVRGNRRSHRSTALRSRSIPACAGEPFPTGNRYSARGVYPRVCGGTRPCLAAMRLPAGLSPRVRGNRMRSPRPRPSPGSIPACAGEPRSAACSSTGLWVYPRVCGGTRSRASGSRGG